MRKNKSLTGSVDWILLFVVLILMAMGIATVYSTAYIPEHESIFDLSQVYGKQTMWAGVSLFLGILVFLIDSDIYRKFALPIFVISIGLLAIVLFMPAKNGAHSWLGIGSLGIQPGEFAKIATAILLARFIGDLNQKQQTIKTVLMANGIILIPMVMILLQPDAGTFVVFTAFLFVLYREGLSYDPIILKVVNLLPGIKFRQTWVGSHFIPILFVVVFLSITTLLFSNETIELSMFPGTKFPGYYGVLFFIFLLSVLVYVALRLALSKREAKRAAIIAVMGFVLAAGITKTVDYGFQKLAGHQKQRIELFLGLTDNEQAKDGVDYNRNRAIASVGSGGLFGKGYKNSTLANVRSAHVPESETDFIFCPFAEEWGFVGSFVLVVLYIFMMLRIVIIAERQRSTFNRVYAYSVAMILFYHFAINIGMSIEFAPVIGIPLPFFSYGGSSMMSFSMMMFILLKLDSQRKDVLN
ncbi:MAG: rod shape-determining protein RodA [Crocinitomicaceae bacterium]|nr:rod shape-determining protein RodA [Crocinitomicaceae bacterium]